MPGSVMGRIRTIKPEFFRSRSLAKCDVATRVTFAGLWVEADDFGNGIADPRVLKGAVWPLDDTIGWTDVENHLQQLQATGHVLLYEVDGERYYHVVKWTDHQSAAFRRGGALFPVHPDACTLQDFSCGGVLEQGTGNREQGTGIVARKRRTAIPESWQPNERHMAFANEHSIDLNHEVPQFRDHHEAKGSVYLDWDKAFWTWLRNASKWSRPRGERAVGGVSSAQAWERVTDALSRGQRPKFDDRTEAVIKAMGGWQQLRVSTNQIADRAHFLKFWQDT